MPFFEYVPLLFGGCNSLLNTTQTVVEHDIEIRLPVIPFHIERLAGYSEQLVQGFSEPVELSAHGFVLGCAGRRIAPLGLQRKVHQDLVVLGVGLCVGFLESVIFPLAVAGHHNPATGRNLDGEHVPTPASLDKEERFFALFRSSHGEWRGQRRDGGELRQLLGYGYQREPVCRGKCLEGRRDPSGGW